MKQLTEEQLREGLNGPAEQLFNAYNNEPPNPWKTFDGRDVPRWDALSEQVKAKWRAVAYCALEWA